MLVFFGQNDEHFLRHDREFACNYKDQERAGLVKDTVGVCTKSNLVVLGFCRMWTNCFCPPELPQ